MSQWKCSRCTCFNEDVAVVCGACGIQRPPANLPPGWSSALCKNTGKYYYYNQVTQVTQWIPPSQQQPKPTLAPQGVPYSQQPVQRHSDPSPASPKGQPASPKGQPASPKGQVSTTLYVGNMNGSTTPEKWVCPTCTVQNYTTTKTCMLCGSARSNIAITEWSCSKCTYINKATQAVCGMCSTPPSKQDSIRRAFEKRKNSETKADPLLCKRCTFKNREGWHECEVCGFASTNQRGGCSKVMHGISFATQDTDWLERVKEIERSSPDFVDETFPPTIHSIYGAEMDTLGPADTGNITEWKRYKELGGGRFHASSNSRWILTTRDATGLTFSPDVISQGALGDCWFLSAVAVICTRPELIRRLFISTDISPSGVYALRFWHNGVWTPVLVDDHLPATPHGTIAFATGKGNLLWPSLIEKAYAKLHGSYSAICSGTAGDALTDLTGVPCSKIDLERSDTDMVWTELLSCYSSGCLMAASCGKKDSSKEAYRKLGLVTKHCYTILGITDALGVRLVNLRNPWGTEVWKGEWGERSPLWTPEAMQILGLTRVSGDGTFWMAFPEFLLYFPCVDVCKSHENWFSCSEVGWFSRKAVPSGTAQYSDSYVLTTSTPTWAFISIVQRDQRGAEQAYSYKDAAMTVVRVTSEGATLNPQHMQHVATVPSSIQRITTCEVILNQPGTYIVFPFSMLNLNKDTNFTLAMWSSKKIELRKQPMQGLHPITSALHSMFRSPEMRVKINVNVPFSNTKVLYIQAVHGIWFFAQNMTSQTLLVKLDCSGSHGLVSNRGLITADTIPPGGSMILMMATATQQFGGWRWKCSQKFELGHLTPQHHPPLPQTAHLHDTLYDLRGLQMYR